MTRTSYDIFLLEVASDSLVPAKLFEGLSPKNIDDHQNIWVPQLQSHNQNLTRLGLKTGFAQDAHWSWSNKVNHTSGQMGFKHFAIEVNGSTEGLMMIRLIASRSRIDPPKELVYIDYLSVAPWNRATIQKPQRYKLIGTVLFYAAVQVSQSEDMNGRVGLHSLPDANSWYTKIGMQDFGPDMSVQNLNYFELSEVRAQEMLKEMED